MARSPRLDAPGRFHHIYNRAARRQVLFADRRDYRYFLALTACAVRRGELVVHAYCLMGTHFHLLAASPDGRISYTLMRIQNAYARYRNRRSRLDGPLFRGRFGSRPVRSALYWITLLRYIGLNAAHAGLSKTAFDYPYSSARHFVERRCPPWFDRSSVARRLDSEELAPIPLARRYADVIRTPLSDGEIYLISQRMAQPRRAEDDLDALYRAPPAYLAKWMARKISAAGGRSPWTTIAGPDAVMHAVDGMRARCGSWQVGDGQKLHDGWLLLRSGLLATLACLSVDSIASLLQVHRATAARNVRRHRALLSHAPYATQAGHAARAAIDRTFQS